MHLVLYRMFTFQSLKNETFSSHSFEIEKLDFIEVVRTASIKPEFEFLHPELELAKIDWVMAVKEFNAVMLDKIYSVDSGGYGQRYSGIPREWDSKRFHEAADQIREKEELLCEKFEVLVKLGRRILKVS